MCFYIFIEGFIEHPKKVVGEMVDELNVVLYKQPLLFISSHHKLVSLLFLLNLYPPYQFSYKNGSKHSRGARKSKFLKPTEPLKQAPMLCECRVIIHEILAIQGMFSYLSLLLLCNLSDSYDMEFVMEFCDALSSFNATKISITRILRGQIFVFFSRDGVIRILSLLDFVETFFPIIPFDFKNLYFSFSSY